MRSSNKEIRILAIYTLRCASGRNHFSGVLDYLSEHGNYSLFMADPAFMDSSPGICRLSDYDGFIVALDGGARFMNELAKSDKPTVLVNIDNPALTARGNVACVWLDNAAIGKEGARHLTGRGDFASYGFVPNDSGVFYNVERATAFRRETASQRPSADIRIYDTKEDLADWLKALPKPAAVMASDAIVARRVLTSCRHAKIGIPSDLALISVDNDTTLTKRNNPTISSIIPDSRYMGYRAMQELDRLLTGKKELPFHEVIVEKLHIADRESTSCSFATGSLAKTALSYIHAHADSPLSVSTVVKQLNRSRRFVDMRLKSETGKTLREAILDERLSRAETLLLGGHTVKDVAKQLRFTSANQLTRVFASRHGRTISAWLKDAQLSASQKGHT